MDRLQNNLFDPVKIKAARGDATLSETALKLGISTQHLWFIETGRRGASYKLMQKVCVLYGKPLKHFIRAKILTAA